MATSPTSRNNPAASAVADLSPRSGSESRKLRNRFCTSLPDRPADRMKFEFPQFEIEVFSLQFPDQSLVVRQDARERRKIVGRLVGADLRRQHLAILDRGQQLLPDPFQVRVDDG